MEAYLDNSATTQPCKEAVDKMNYALKTCWGNPSSLHAKGIAASELIEDSRRNIAKALSCESSEIFFTSGGTEANNLAIIGTATAKPRNAGKKIIVGATEHSSVLQSANRLKSLGFNVVFIPSPEGVWDMEKYKFELSSDTILVSAMLVNNETGAVNDIAKIAAMARRVNPEAVVHCDAVQAFGKVQLKPYNMGVDLMSISSHKIHGPKGAGALFVKKGTRLVQHTYGGLQESKIRPGTEPVPAIAGFGAAAAAIPDCKQSLKYATELRDYMVSRLRAIDGVRINSPENALPYITNISVEGIPSEVMLNYLSGMGIYISSGSACSKGHKSRVLKAMNLSEDVISTALRISTSVFTTKEEIDMLIGGISSARQTMRRMK